MTAPAHCSNGAALVRHRRACFSNQEFSMNSIPSNHDRALAERLLTTALDELERTVCSVIVLVTKAGAPVLPGTPAAFQRLVEQNTVSRLHIDASHDISWPVSTRTPGGHRGEAR